MTKTLYLTVLFNLLMFYCSAQLRYSNRFFQEIDTLKNIEYAQADFLDNPFGVLADYNVHEGENKTSVKSLYMDIFFPKDDTISKRPAILFAHSGGFLIGSRHNDDMLAFCDSFAHRGYVAATMDYRLGMGASISRLFGIPVKVSVDSINGSRAVYRSIQDSRAAIRYLRHNADVYRIDTTKIFMVGSSAGGFVSLHNLYMDKENEIIEAALSPPTLGSLDTVGIQGYDGKANATVSLWGALQTPDLIENESRPALLIHGEDDEVVYFKKGMPLKNSIPDLDVLEFSVPETYGGYCIDTALANRNIPHETYFVKGQRHEFYGVDTGDWEENGPNEYWDTIQWKISNFFFDLFRPVAEFIYTANGRTIDFNDLTANSSYSEWDLGDGTSTTGPLISHTYQTPGNYKVTLKSCNKNMACDTLSQTIEIKNAVGIEQNAVEEINIFPNPNTGYVTIIGLHENFHLEVYNLQGKKQAIQLYGNRLNISHLPNGVYLLKIVSKKQTIIKKLQKVQ